MVKLNTTIESNRKTVALFWWGGGVGIEGDIDFWRGVWYDYSVIEWSDKSGVRRYTDVNDL